MNHYLITGGAGHIGYILARELVDLGDKVTVFDYDSQKESIKNIDGQIRIIFGDVRDYDTISKAIGQADGVVHLAAVSRVVWGFKDPVSCVDINVNGTNTVLEAIRNSKHQPFVIFGSSREVYGEPQELPCQECAPKQSVNVYGATKIAGENLMEAYYHNYDIKGVILRFSNVFGTRWDQLDRVIPKFIRNALLDAPLILQGGKQILDPTYIDDTINAIVLAIDALEKDKIQFDDFNVLRGEPIKLLDLAEKIIEFVDSSSVIEYSPARHYDVEKFYGDPSKAQKILKFVSKTPLDKALDLTITDLRDYWKMWVCRN